MTRLFLVIFSIVGVTGAGIGVVAALVMGFDTVSGILISAALGTLIGAPASWLISKQLIDA